MIDTSSLGLADLMDPFQKTIIPLAEWTKLFLHWLSTDLRPLFQTLKWPVAELLKTIQTSLVQTPPLVFLLILFGLVWQIAGLRIAVFAVLGFVFLGLIGVWQDTMVTLALVITSVTFCVALGVPIGILAARNDRFERLVRPVLDVMQTLPTFVYLVPIVMLVGIGNVPGVIVTVIVALPPLIRMTSLGIRGVPATTVEAAYAFGSTPLQVLLRVQFPLAMPSIMAGLNQTVMMALAMVVYASMIAVGGLGLLVLRGIGSLDMGLATLGGAGIVLVAMVLDRTTQALGRSRRQQVAWVNQGPVGLIASAIRRRNRALSRETEPQRAGAVEDRSTNQ